ncbi:hypothetical protein [Desulfobacula toluolica]|nr:hypothetical protein [Desulfobacula toluolica]
MSDKAEDIQSVCDVPDPGGGKIMFGPDFDMGGSHDFYRMSDARRI